MLGSWAVLGNKVKYCGYNTSSSVPPLVRSGGSEDVDLTCHRGHTTKSFWYRRWDGDVERTEGVVSLVSTVPVRCKWQKRRDCGPTRLSIAWVGGYARGRCGRC